MHINNLTLCLTRKCQLSCSHCMRGPAQKLTMDPQVVYDLMGQGLKIESLLLTGGEPTLAPDIMRLVGDGLHMTSTEVGSVSMVTNGISFTKKPMEAFDWIHRFTTNMHDDTSFITISKDQWHKFERDDPIRDNLSEHPLFHGERGEIQTNQLLVVGNWDKTTGGYGESDEHVPNLEKFKAGECHNCPNAMGGFNVVVTAKGNVVLSENMSYKQEDDPANILCHVADLRKTLEEIYERTDKAREDREQYAEDEDAITGVLRADG